MSIIIIIVIGIILICFFGAIFFAFYFLRDKVVANDRKVEKLDWFSKGLLFIAVLILLFSFVSPYLFTRGFLDADFDFYKTGTIGDTIGGIMNPFISIVGVIVTGLAFYMQYNANKIQRELFYEEQERAVSHFNAQFESQAKENELQKFEYKFYEMLRMHRENVVEFRIDGYDFMIGKNGVLEKFKTETFGRKVFVTMHTELECIINIYLKVKKQKDLNQAGFKICYEVFFNGKDFVKKNITDNEPEFITELEKARVQHKNDDLIYETNSQRKSYNGVELKFNYKPFSGHASRLGHYFRQLYLMVGTVVNSTILNEEDKTNYLRILRAQLSNHEQILLFYNWLNPDFGGNWENENNQYFSKYKMIHNLWYTKMLQDIFVLERINWIRNRGEDVFEID